MLARFNTLPPTVRQLTAYLLIGGFTTSLNFVLFAAAIAAFDWRSGTGATLTSTAAYVITSVLAYFLNSRIAFRDQHAGDSAGTMTRFALTFASSAAVSAAVFRAVHSLGGESTTGLALAEVVSIGTVIVWNFTFLRLWVFAPVRKREVAHAR